MKTTFKALKILSIFVCFLGISGFVDPNLGWIPLSITMAIGALMYTVIKCTEILIDFLIKILKNSLLNNLF